MTTPFTAFNNALGQIDAELIAAQRRFPPFHSAHEAMSVLREEVDELWAEVKVKQGSRDKEKMRKEAAQIAAMAIRFILDVCNHPEDR